MSEPKQNSPKEEKMKKLITEAPFLLERAEKVMYSERVTEFGVEIENMIKESPFLGDILGQSIDFIEKLENGTNYDEVMSQIDSLETDSIDKGILLDEVLHFSKQGPDFVKYGRSLGNSLFNTIPQNRIDEIETQNINYKANENVRNHMQEADSFIIAGKKYIYPEREEEWNQTVEYDMGLGEKGIELLSATVNIMKELESRKPIDEIEGIFESHLGEGNNKLGFVLRNHILQFSKRGPEFEERYLTSHPEVDSELRRYKIDEVVRENAEFESNSIGKKTERSGREKTISAINKNKFMKEALENQIQEVDKQIAVLRDDNVIENK